jgi:hypothetical protein
MLIDPKRQASIAAAGAAQNRRCRRRDSAADLFSLQTPMSSCDVIVSRQNNEKAKRKREWESQEGAQDSNESSE